ncbi:MAG: hypothetical protein V4702_01565 [Patescibacteria group bacterium]
MSIKKLLNRFTTSVIAVFAIPVFALVPIASAASNVLVDFEAYTPGTINGQDGWSSTGAAGLGCALYDHEVDNSNGVTNFGDKSLRISNAITSGCFGDQTFSKSLAEEAGETSAQNGSLSGGTRQPYFEAQWSFASTTPSAEQPGLAVVASPDRGDGARMSWIQMTDTPTGLAVNFFDYQSGTVGGTCANGLNFVSSPVASNLDRTVPHNIKVTMEFVDGVANDVVKVYVDGVLGHTGTSWEDYFRECELNQTRTVDSVLFRTGGTAVPANQDKGFLVDNLSLSSGPIPPVLVGPATNKDECKNNDWKNFNNPTYKNQGDCVSAVASKGRNQPSGSTLTIISPSF